MKFFDFVTLGAIAFVSTALYMSTHPERFSPEPVEAPKSLADDIKSVLYSDPKVIEARVSSTLDIDVLVSPQREPQDDFAARLCKLIDRYSPGMLRVVDIKTTDRTEPNWTILGHHACWEKAS